MGFKAPLAATVIAALWSFALVSISSQIDRREWLPETPTEFGLDYGRSAGARFEPLSDAFIALALGVDRGGQQPPGVPAAPALDVVRTPGPRGTEAPLARTVVRHPPTNDRVDSAYRVTAIPFTARTDSAGAGRQPGEPGACSPAGDTVWYRYQANDDGTLIASTIGTRRPTTLAVFTGAPADLRPVRCASHVDGNAKTAFRPVAGTTYFFQLGTPAGGGPVVFNLDPFGTTRRVSVSSGGAEANADSNVTGLSSDGRWVVFLSWASNLVDGDANEVCDVFVHDRARRETTRVSVGSDGTEGDAPSGGGFDSISDDGRYVAFSSEATNLVEGDTNDWPDVFVRDRWTGQTTRISVASSGEQAAAPIDPGAQVWRTNERPHGGCFALQGVSMSADGRFVAFESALSGLVEGDDELGVGSNAGATDGALDVFVHDRWTGETTMVSVASDGTRANDWSDSPDISADGRFVAFRSQATNLVAGDTNGLADNFVHDRLTGVTTRVTVDSHGGQANDESQIPSLSSTGRYVTFHSWASNLVADDSNEARDVFVHDRQTGDTALVSVTSHGEQHQGPEDPLNRSNLGLPRATVTADGRFVVFESASDLDGRDEAPLVDFQGIFVHDRLAGTTFELSVPTYGDAGRPYSWSGITSADGRVVAFTSQDAGLVEGDHNERSGPGSGDDVFVVTFPVLR